MKSEGAKYKFKEKAFKKFYALLDKEYKVVDLSEFDELRNNFLAEYISEEDQLSTVTTQLKVSPNKAAEVYAALDDIGEVTVVDKKYLTEKFISILREDFLNWCSFLW